MDLLHERRIASLAWLSVSFRGCVVYLSSSRVASYSFSELLWW
jgi:hypothetical protein